MIHDTSIYPHRHQSLETARRRLKRTSRRVKGGVELSEKQWNNLGAGLRQSDPLADALVEWIQEHKDGSGWLAVRSAIASGLDSLDESQRNNPALRDFFETVESVPDWVDREKIALGQRQISRAYPAGYYILRNAGLMAGYLASDVNKPLVLTGALSGGASRRMAQTMKWYSDCVDANGLNLNAPGYQSTLHVRILHATIRKQIVDSDNWDQIEMGLPINQTDMAVTWLAFSVVYLVGIRLMGVPVSQEESESVMHLMSYACWLMGLDQEWLTDNEREGQRLLFQILATYRTADESSYQLGRALMGEVSDIPYQGLRPIRWRLEQLKHLSTTRLFVGRKGMKELGLPTWIPPFYPLACIPTNTFKHRVAAKIPALKSRFENNGTIKREKLVQLHFAGAEPHLASTGH